MSTVVDDTTAQRCKDALVRALAELGADSGTVHVKAPESQTLLLAAWQGPMPEPVLAMIRQIPVGKGMAGQAAERVEPVGTCNIQTTRSPDVQPGARTTLLQGALVVPMLLGDAVVGTFGVGTNAERTFTAKETRQLWESARALARSLAPSPLAALRAALHTNPGLPWLEENIIAAQHGDAAALSAAFPAVSRKLGRESLAVRHALVRSDGVEVPLRAFRADDAGRVALLAAFSGDAEALARQLYFSGDLRERAGTMRGLALVGHSDAAVDVFLDAFRQPADELVEAALADNPYSGRHLPDHELRRAVLKCAAIGISIERVVGLQERADAELTTGLLSLVSERETATRAVPPSIWPIAGAAPVPGLIAKLIGYLEHPIAAHRAGAARGLALANDARARPFLDERLARESDESVRRAIGWALG